MSVALILSDLETRDTGIFFKDLRTYIHSYSRTSKFGMVTRAGRACFWGSAVYQLFTSPYNCCEHDAVMFLCVTCMVGPLQVNNGGFLVRDGDAENAGMENGGP